MYNQENNPDNPHFFGLDRFVPFFGIVEDRDDPLTIGRCKVRIFGVHPEDDTLVTTDQLPWAMPIQSIQSAATSGIGYSPVGPIVGTHVVGFFADGMDRQIPFFFGTFAGGVGHFNYGNGQGEGSSGGSDGNSAYGPNGDPNQPAANPGSGTKPIVLPKGSKALITRAVNLGSALHQKFPALKDNHIAGIIGNMWVESCGFQYIREGRMRQAPENPGPKWQKGQKVIGTGYGWAQWSGPRLNSFIDYTNKYYGGKYQSDEAQWGYLMAELNDEVPGFHYGYIIKKLASNVTNAIAPGKSKGHVSRGPWDLTTVNGATGYFMATFENPSPTYCHYEERCGAAQQFLQAYHKTGAPVRGTAQGKK